MKAVLGERYDLAAFEEGKDYKRYKIRVGTRVAFRNGILAELGGKPAERSEPQAVPVKQSQPVEVEREVVVTRKYPNPRYVETTAGQVFVGGKPVKLGQKIRVRNNELVLRPVSYLG